MRFFVIPEKHYQGSCYYYHTCYCYPFRFFIRYLSYCSPSL